MGLKDLFRKNAPAAAPEAAGADDDVDAGAMDAATEPEALDEHADEELAWRERAAAVIPGGASTGSKRPDALYGPNTAFGPTHFVSASGCTVVSVTGVQYLDCTMALGAVALGYAEPTVTRAVVEAASRGNVSGLSSTLEVEVAERLCEVIPCAERVRFVKTGAEAVAAAVRIARASTGRSRVIASGYFGWLDWACEGDVAGIPAGARADVTRVPFDDVSALERAAAAAGRELAAIVLEPVIERLPSPEWIAAARAACDRAAAVLVFDEIKTGFRLRPGGYHEYAEVRPDLALFGKAMANGHPLAAVVGRADVMEAAARTWISSTLAGETMGLAAAAAVLGLHERAEICEALWEIGGEMQAAVGRAITSSGVDGVRVDGVGPMWLMRFDDPARQSRFQELALGEGVLFKRGAYNFASLAHDEQAIGEIESAASTALVTLRDEPAP